jgi:signal transduction histidine kinase
MRIRLFFSFAIVIMLTLVVLGFVIRTESQTVITSFARSGGFYGADRVINQYADYYSEHGSWEGITMDVAGENPQGTGDGSGGSRGRGGGGGGGQAGGGYSSSGMFANQDQFSLADSEGVVLLSLSLPVGDALSKNVLDNGFEIFVDEKIVGYLIPASNILDVSEIITQELNDSLTESIAPTALIGTIAAIVLATILAALLMRPIRQLTRAANQVASGDLSQRVPVSGRDEIGQLAASFNQMADSLEASRQARQAMTADIAHELRTPLSIQRANLEAFQDGIYPLTLDNLSPIIQQNNLLTKLVEDLRTLALADAGELHIEKVSTDLNALITVVCNDFQARFSEMGVSLVCKSDQTCPQPLLDPNRISQVIYNLLHNSLRHTPEGGKVEITTACEGSVVTIKLRDSGEGIPEEALPHLFDRFYRSDQSRSRDKGGSGLGLAIAMQIIQAHGGTISAANHPQGGAEFTIHLPGEPG